VRPSGTRAVAAIAAAGAAGERRESSVMGAQHGRLEPGGQEDAASQQEGAGDPHCRGLETGHDPRAAPPHRDYRSMTAARYRHEKPSRDRRFRALPGSDGLPIVGHLFPFLFDQPSFIRTHYERYGPVFRINLGGMQVAIALGAELAEQVLLDKQQRFSNELGYQRLAPLFGRGLVQYDFEEHRFQRRLFQTAFKADALRGYVRLIADDVARELETWRDADDCRVYPHVKRLLLRSGLSVFYGLQDTSEQNETLADAFVDLINGSVRIFDVDLPGFRLHAALRARKLLRGYIQRLIPERRERAGADMLSHLCKEKKESGEWFSDDELIDHASFLLFAAHETTASLLQHLVYYLTLYPDWQRRIREEAAGRSALELDYDDLQNLKRLGRVIDEVLRMHSPAPAMMRVTLQDVVLAGVTVPANSFMMLIPGFNHHVPGEWLNPQSFDPERFAPERNEHRRHAFNYIPFGGGAHKCIGMHFARMQAQLFATELLYRYDFSTPPRYRPAFQYFPLPRIRDGLPLQLTPRRR
jgi:cytochrome P450